MTDTTTAAEAPAFTLKQHATLKAWHTGNPTKLRVTIYADHDDFEEIAEIGRDPRLALWMVHPVPAGTGVMLVGGDGVGWAVAGLVAALAEIETREAMAEA